MPDALFPGGATMVFGATGGIGQVVAKEFAKAGSEIAIMYRSKDTLAKELKAEIEDMERVATIHQCDVTDEKKLQNVIRDAVSEHGKIHTMVWGAGPLVEQVMIQESSFNQWKKAVDVEVHGFYKACHILIGHMRVHGGGSFVHLGSAGDVSFPPKDFLSVAPKAANESLVKGIAREEGMHNIRANSVLVGVIEAGMFLELTRQGVFTQEWVEEVQKSLALKRWGQPEEIANAAIFLASNKAAYVTGQQINVSGGYGL